AGISISTGAIISWNPGVCNTSGYVVRSIVVSSAADIIYIGGQFNSVGVGGAQRSRIAAVSMTTGLATSWAPVVNGEVKAMVMSGNRLYIGGLFTTIGGQSRNRIGAIDTATGNPTSWNPTGA